METRSTGKRAVCETICRVVKVVRVQRCVRGLQNTVLAFFVPVGTAIEARMRRTRTIVRYNRTIRDAESNLPKIRVSRGLSVQELVEKAGINLGQYLQLSTGEMSPFYEMTHGKHEKGEIKDSVLKIMKVLNCEFHELFPRYACKLPCEYLTQGQIDLFCVSEYSLGKQAENIERFSFPLADRERKVVEDRVLDGKTLQNVA